jgi:Tol biopolymer transport system component
LAYTLWNPHTDRPEIWVWDLARRIHNTPLANFRQPDFGPQGRLVANAHGGGGMDNLVTMGLFGEGAQIISAHSADGRPHWSPDGKKIVFDSALMGDRQYRLYLQDDLGNRNDRPPMMYAGFEIFGRYPIFLADGRIAYNGCDYWLNGSICGIHVLSIEGAQPVNVTGWPGDVPTDNLGSRILFMSDRGGSWDIYSINADGSDLRQLTDLPGVEGLATASPDNNEIAYLTNQDGAWAFYVMAADGSRVRKLFDLPGNFGRGEYDWFYERISWGR